MACVSIGRTVIPTPLVGTPVVLELRFNNNICEVHTIGTLEGCAFTTYRQALCCGNEKSGYDVPILGYNTTSSVYVLCNGDGLIPTPNPIATITHATTPHRDPSTETLQFPRPTTSQFPANNGHRIKVGAIFWLTIIAVVIF